jgi:hypothetical protein
LLEDFNVKLEKEDTFKPTTGNESSHKGKGKDKFVPVLFLTEHHAMKAYWCGGMAPRNLDLDTGWR